MKNFFISLVFFLTSNICISQNNIDNLFNEVINKKENDFLVLKSHFKDIDFTIDLANNFLDKCAKANYVTGKIFMHTVLAGLYRRKSNYNEALKIYNEALQISKTIKNKELESVVLNEIGIVYRRQGKIRQSLNYHQQVLEIVSNINDLNKNLNINESIAINSIGNIYLTLKQYDKALNMFNKSLAIERKLNDKRGLAINYQNIGFVYQNIGELDIALKKYNKSLEYNTANNDKLGKIICYDRVANVFILKGNYNEAYKYINEIFPLLKGFDNQYYLAKVYNTKALVLLKLNKDDEVKKYLEIAIKISLEAKTTENLVTAYKILSELNQKQGNYQEALNDYKKSITIENEEFNKKAVDYINNLISKYDNEINNNKLRALAKETEISNLKLLRNRNILIIALVSIALFGVLLYSIYRQKLLKNDKQILVLEQDALRIQMNPHFVFNALNSIKLYIINNEQKNAVRYLNKFSKLIRSILESSNIKEVSLSEELKTMHLYMSIENIRFSNEIIYEENFTEELNLDTIKIPPLVLQPFLENAIWHGLSSKEGEKKILLSVKKLSDEFILIEIEDNGVGRDEAFRIKSNKTLNRKSIGIELTKERLLNFSTQFQNEYSLDYLDLIDENASAAGTRVTIKLPIA